MMPAKLLPHRSGTAFGASIRVIRRGLAWQILGPNGTVLCTCEKSDVAHYIATVISDSITSQSPR